MQKKPDCNADKIVADCFIAFYSSQRRVIKNPPDVYPLQRPVRTEEIAVVHVVHVIR